MESKLYIGHKIKVLSCVLGQEVSRSTAALDLTASQAFFLGYLVSHANQPVYPRDLEREFEFSHPTVSGILRRMEAKGFITFRTGENDRRRKQILPTEKAFACCDAITANIERTEAAATNGMSAAEIAELNRLLDKVITNLGATSECCRPKEEE